MSALAECDFTADYLADIASFGAIHEPFADWSIANFNSACSHAANFRKLLEDRLGAFLLYGPDTPAATQSRILIFYIMKKFARVFRNVKFYVKSNPSLNSAQYKLLKAIIKFYSDMSRKAALRIAKDTAFSLDRQMPLESVCGKKLRDPLTVNLLMEPEGCTVNCLEIPQLYGYGDTPEEAFTMLEEEIIGMRDDLEATDMITYENFCLYLLLKSVFPDEKRTV